MTTPAGAAVYKESTPVVASSGLIGRTAIVTGASRGIGRAVVHRLLAEGVRVVAGARHAGDLASLAPESELQVVEGDLATANGPAALVERALTVFGTIDILVNNVGDARPRTGGFGSITDQDWEATLEINLMSAVRATREVLPTMVEHSSGSVITVTSVNSTLADPLVLDYSAAKAALLSMSKSLSKELAPRGIRVNTVSPGPVSTDLWLAKGGLDDTVAQETGTDTGTVADAVAAGMPTGRFSSVDEVADVILFLAGDAARNMTGTDIVIDGGMIPTT